MKQVIEDSYNFTKNKISIFELWRIIVQIRLTMAFKDDMIDAGFSDEMSYLEHLMDQGDWIVDQQIEREREMLNYQDSPYDGLSPKKIERM